MTVYSVHLNLSSNSPIFAKCANGNSPPLPPLKRTPGLQYRLLSLGTKSPRFERSQASSSTSHVSNIPDQPERRLYTLQDMIFSVSHNIGYQKEIQHRLIENTLFGKFLVLFTPATRITMRSRFVKTRLLRSGLLMFLV